MNTRRRFLIRAPLGFLVGAAALRGGARAAGAALDPDPHAAPPAAAPPSSAAPPAPPDSTPGAPPTFGTGTGSGPAVTPATFAEAEKLMQVTLTPEERQQAADTWRQSIAPYLERRTGPRAVALSAAEA